MLNRGSKEWDFSKDLTVSLNRVFSEYWVVFDAYKKIICNIMATHSSTLAWRIPGTEEPGGLLSMGSHRVGHDWSDLAAATAYIIKAILKNWHQWCHYSIEEPRTSLIMLKIWTCSSQTSTPTHICLYSISHRGNNNLNAEFIIPLLFLNNLTSHGSISKQDILNFTCFISS